MVIIAYHEWLLPYLCFTFSGCMLVVVTYQGIVQHMSAAATRKGGEHVS